MLTRVDRVQLVVADRAAAVETWQACFGAIVVGDDESALLGARRTTVQAGDSEFEFLEPSGPGLAQTFRERRGQGLFGAGFATPDLHALARHFDAEGVPARSEGDRLFLDATQTHGMPATFTREVERERVGHLRHLYEVTNPVADWRETAAHYARIFALDASRFSPISSATYGYDGTLTLFDPPRRLDRIEVTQTFGGGAMDRFYQKNGPSLYMCYVEVDDVMGLARRLQERNARFAHSERRDASAGLFIHPTSLHGMLMGVSRTDFAWVWSGRPELAGPGATEIHTEN